MAMTNGGAEMTLTDALMAAVDCWWTAHGRYMAPGDRPPEYVRVILGQLEAEGHGFDLASGDWI
jgi:hypothetical protein